MCCRKLLRVSLSVLFIVASLWRSRAARADEPDPFHDREVEEVAHRVDRADQEDQGALFAALDLGGRLRRAQTERADLLAMITVGGSFGAVPAPRSDAPPDEAAAPDPADESPLLPTIDVIALSKLGREAIARARVVAGEASELERIEDLGTRARWSALLPEVRFRIARVVDEDRAFSPTEYDPERVTTGNQESFWLEGRAAFRLDRLAFASEEVSLERLRLDRHREDRKRELEVIGWLRRYTRAAATLRNDATLPDAALAAEVDRLEAIVALDVLTGGWFSTAVPATETPPPAP